MGPWVPRQCPNIPRHTRICRSLAACPLFLARMGVSKAPSQSQSMVRREEAIPSQSTTRLRSPKQSCLRLGRQAEGPESLLEVDMVGHSFIPVRKYNLAVVECECAAELCGGFGILDREGLA